MEEGIGRDHREKLAGVFKNIFGWLKPGGYSYFTLASEQYTGEARFVMAVRQWNAVAR